MVCRSPFRVLRLMDSLLENMLGPECLSNRYSQEQRAASKAKDITYSDILQLITHTQENSDGQSVIVKDMAQC